MLRQRGHIPIPAVYPADRRWYEYRDASCERDAPSIQTRLGCSGSGRISTGSRGQGRLGMQIHPREQPTMTEAQGDGRPRYSATCGRGMPRWERNEKIARSERGAIGAQETIGIGLLWPHTHDGVGRPADHLGAIYVENVEKDIGAHQEQDATEDAPPHRRPA